MFKVIKLTQSKNENVIHEKYVIFKNKTLSDTTHASKYFNIQCASQYKHILELFHISYIRENRQDTCEQRYPRFGQCERN